MPAPHLAAAAKPTHRGETLAVVLLSALPPLAALLVFGTISGNDSPSYLAYADALRALPLPSGEALLRSSPQPATLFRTPGYPAVLAGLQALAPERWPLLLVWLQVAAIAGASALAHRAALALGLGRWPAMAAALMPAAGYASVVQAMVMTDALYGALFASAALVLLRGGLAGGRIGAALLAGSLLGVAMLVREATVYLVLGFLPAAAIAVGRGRRVVAVLLVAAPAVLAAAGLAAWNHGRSGHAVLSTSRQVVMVQALLPALAQGVPVYHGDDPYDRILRETVAPQGYAGIDAANARLFEAGLASPDIAALASARYLRAWREHPAAMLRAMGARFPVKMLWVTFMPVDMAAEFYRQTGHPRPWFGQERDLARRLAGGSPLAGALLLALAAGRAVGLAVALGAMLAPVLVPRRDPRWWPLFGTWCVCGGLIGVYLPVHIEQRYLVPVVPLACLLGVAAIASLGRYRRSRPAPDGRVDAGGV